jgi:hypothetical protein
MAQNREISKEEVIKFLQANLKDGENRVGIETTTDGDPGPSIGLFTQLIYNYPHDHEKNYDDGGVEDASEVVVVNRVTVDDVLKILNAMLD